MGTRGAASWVLVSAALMATVLPARAWAAPPACARVAVLDSGVDVDHPDLRPNLWRNPGEIAANGIDDDQDGYVDDVYGADLVRGHGSGIDRNGHGTHVAGIIAARGDHRRGVAGVCRRASLISVRVLGAGLRGHLAVAAAGIVYAVEHGAEVVNTSFGATHDSPELDAAVAFARARGVLIVASAGNAGTDTATHPHYPSGLPSDNIVSVGATDALGHRAPFSNYGADVDLTAPGVEIISTWPGGTYRRASGTSMAAAFVSGTAARLRARQDLSPRAVRARLVRRAVHPG